MRGSQLGQRIVYRHREESHEHLLETTLKKNKRRYRMRRELFLQLIDAICVFDRKFVHNACSDYYVLAESTILMATCEVLGYCNMGLIQSRVLATIHP